MASKEVNNLNNLLIIYLYKIDLSNLSLFTNYIFDFDYFITESFDEGDEDINSFKSKPIY